jgi:small subunit ribosomal protein S6
MRDYEVVIILQPDLDETAVGEAIERVKSWITDAGGSIEKVDLWGKRRLAYRIRKQRDGIYVLIQAKIETSFTAELERNLQLFETVMRFMITRMDD